VPFGVASLIAPTVLVLFAVARAAQALAGGGPVFGLLLFALEAVVALVGIALLVRTLHGVIRSGASRLRFVAVTSALLSGVVVAGIFISVPVTTTFGFVRREASVVLVLAGDRAAPELPASVPVIFLSNGILMNERIGEGTARMQRPDETTAPLEAFLPVEAQGVSVPATKVARVDLAETSASMPAAGQARVVLGARNLWQALWEAGVMQPLSAFRSEK
jgi:putative peptide zinc metalloprotease protein